MSTIAEVVFGEDQLERLSKRQWSWIAKAKADIVGACDGDLDTARDEIPDRARRFAAMFPNASLTPTALAKHWQALANGRTNDTVSDWSEPGTEPPTQGSTWGVSDWNES